MSVLFQKVLLLLLLTTARQDIHRGSVSSATISAEGMNNDAVDVSSIILQDPDKLNAPFDSASNLKDVTEEYLRLSTLFHLDRESGSEAEQRHVFIKIIHKLVQPHA